MPLHNRKVTGVRVLDIAEEGATAIETMVNQAIKEVQQQKIPIVDIQITDTNCFIILGEKKSDEGISENCFCTPVEQEG